jgi:hypothetical protein
MGKQSAVGLPSHEILSQLALDDPRAFEELRSAMIEDCIARAPQKIQFRLRQLQFRVDGIRRRSSSPLGALMKIQALMWESYFQLNQELQEIIRQRRGAAHSPRPKPRPGVCPTRNARIIEFRARAPRSAS